MRIVKIFSVAVVCLASLIVLTACFFAFRIFAPSKAQQNFAPPEGQQAVSPNGGTILFSHSQGASSFLYVKRPASPGKRLTAAAGGIESEASLSHDGRLVVYAFTSGPEAKSAIWIVGIDGTHAHQITSSEEDALHPVFSPDDSTVLYAASGHTGHSSPIAAPRRHDWDVFSLPAQPSGNVQGATPQQRTHSSFYDLQSLDVAADLASPKSVKILISTTGYPIGSILREFSLGDAGREKIFQPRVSGAPEPEPVFGDARFLHQGMDIVFLAASNPPSGGNFDYNVFSMSEVTGSELKQLTQLKGMISDLRVLPDGNVTFVNGEHIYLLNSVDHSIHQL